MLSLTVSCSQSPTVPEQSSSRQTFSPRPTTLKSSSEIFEEIVNSWIRSKLDYWKKHANNNGDLSLQEFVYDYGVTTDDNFELGEIYLKAQMGGEDANLNLGAQVGFFGDLLGGSAQAKVFCAGKNDGSRDTFSHFVEEFLNDRKFYDSDLQSLQLPSRGISFQMIWREVRTTTDKFGTETETYREIGIDRLAMSTKNILKISEPSKANFTRLSDLESPKKARQSWHSGLCAFSQANNN